MDTTSQERDQKFHYTPALVLTVFMLLIGGFIVLASAGMGGSHEDGPMGFITKQALFCAIGIVMGIFAYYIPHQWMKSYLFFFVLYAILIGLLLSVFLSPSPINASRNVSRWVYIPGIGINFQPSEVAKLGIVLMVATWACLNPQRIQKFFSLGGILPLGCLICSILVLIFIEPDYATTVICGCVAMVTLYISGASARWAGFALVALVILVGYTVVFKVEERSARINAWKNIWSENSHLYAEENRQQIGAVKAIATGQLFGKGLGMGTAKLGWLSEHDSDFIFAVLAEEFGFIGSFSILSGFVFILYAGTSISIRSKDIFGRVVAMGIVTFISLQVLLNVATTSAFVPNTGLTFPFFSKGGSNLILMLISMGLLMGVERESRKLSGKKFIETRSKNSSISNPFEA